MIEALLSFRRSAAEREKRRSRVAIVAEHMSTSRPDAYLGLWIRPMNEPHDLAQTFCLPAVTKIVRLGNSVCKHVVHETPLTFLVMRKGLPCYGS